MATEKQPLFMGFDLSTQQLKAIVIDSDLRVKSQVKVDFDADLGRLYGVHKGVHVRADSGEVYAPVKMWADAVDLCFARLSEALSVADLHRIAAVSGSAQQHGSVYLNEEANEILAKMGVDSGNGESQLADYVGDILANKWSPNWQDQSTQKQCDAFDAELGDRQRLAKVTGSGAHHRFTGPQIMRLKTEKPDVYKKTRHICLVSSWFASLLAGKIVQIDVADVCGMNLWDMRKQQYSEELLALAAGSEKDSPELRRKLGEPRMNAACSFGTISPYFTKRYGIGPSCQVIPFTGDNPGTILALPLRPLDAIVSLGTSTTFLMNTPSYKPDESYHFFNHPTTPGHYMFMLCYKNGGLAREKIRDRLPETGGKGTGWDHFNRVVLNTNALGQATDSRKVKLGLFFPLRETVPNIRAGEFHFECNDDGSNLKQVAGSDVGSGDPDARIILESQALSIRLRSQKLTHSLRNGLPAQPRRIYLVGGGAINPAITQVIGQVLGGTEGVYKLDVGGSACALGGAYKALWALERKTDETFDDFVAKRWKEEGKIEKVDQGYREGTYQKYGQILGAFENMEQILLAQENEARSSNC